MKEFIYTILFIILMFSCPLLLAADRYVSVADGNDSDDGLSEPNAYATIQKGLDNVDAASTLWIKANGTYELSATLDIDTVGNIDIKGYYLIIGDQSPGGVYYKDATNGWAVVDCNDAAGVDPVLSFSQDNVNFYNLKVQDVEIAAKMATVGDDMIGLGFINCWFVDGGQRFYLSQVTSGLFLDCKFEGAWEPDGANILSGIIGFLRNHDAKQLSMPNAVINCTFDVNLNSTAPVVIGQGSNNYDDVNDTTYLIVSGCSILTKNHKAPAKSFKSTAAIAFNGPALIMNNSIHCKDGSVENGIYVGCYADESIIVNNIVSGFTVDINDNTDATYYCTGADGVGTGFRRFYNCLVDDTPVDATEIQTSPLFMDVNNADFRLKPTSTLLNTGMPTIGSGKTSIGAWQRISRIRR